MAVSKKRKKKKTKNRIYLKCRTCGKRVKLSSTGYCSSCKVFNAKVREYEEILKEKGLL